MKELFDDFLFECEIDCNVRHTVKRNDKNEDVHTFSIDWDYTAVDEETKIHINLKKKALGFMYFWNPICGCKRNVPLSVWARDGVSMTSISAPVACVYDGNGDNTFTCALSETKQVVDLRVANVDKGYAIMDIKFKLAQYIKCGHIDLKIYINEQKMPMYKAVDAVRAWWEEECDLKPMDVPECAKDALYSSWYAFGQGLYQEPLLEEAKRASELGLKTIILDDGWQQESAGTRYAFAGDWDVCKSKFGDFYDSVEKMHEWGMKVVLWVAIPYVGYQTELWDRFGDKILQRSDPAYAAILDPRYPDVREYIISTLKRLMVDYNLDGFKLDFIDLFYETPDSKISEEMDYLSVQDGVDKLMVDIKHELSKLNKDALIEFRQKYIGPNMRKYGNMFRVVDCPNDYLTNRVGVIDLRLLSGKTAVHSDMLIWHEEESVEIAALQIVNIIFSTMQYSCKLTMMNEEHTRMVKFWIDFMKENKELLLNSELMVEEPHLLYTLAKTEKNGESAIAVYSKEKCVKLNDNIKKTMIINGTEGKRIIIENNNEKKFRLNVKDCFGNVLKDEEFVLKEGISAIDVPVAGIITLSF